MSGSLSRDVSSGVRTSADVPWACRTHVSVFLKCLHLLDLDLSDDWPGISEKTFTTKSSQQNLQHRVRAVEWSLYRLFELYSPREAQDRLRPFFPPLTSLQSLNLRAALLRSLTELKRNATLARDLVVRKTMLDECKGERVEELLSSFALLVLRSALERYKEGKALLATTAYSSTADRSVPLILARRLSLQGILARRQDLQRRANSESAAIAKEQSDLIRRKAMALRPLHGASAEEVRAAIDIFRSSFTAGSRWMNVAMHEGSSKPTVPAALYTDSQLDAVDQSGWNLVLANLDRCLQRREEELLLWQHFRRSLPNSEALNEPIDTPKPDSHPMLLFDRHRAVSLYVKAESIAVPAPHEPAILPAYQQLLQRLEAELCSTRSTHANSEADIGTALSGTQHNSTFRLKETNAHHCSDCGCQSAGPPSFLPSPDRHSQGASEVPHPDVVSPRTGLDASHFPWLDESSARLGSVDRSLLKAGDGLRCTHVRMKPHNSSSESPLEQGMRTRYDVSPATERKPHRSSTLESGSFELPQQSNTLPSCGRPPTSLLERTRQSMSLAAAAAERKAGAKKVTRSSVSQIPMSQFETPLRAGYSEPALSATSNDSTPHEKLFSDNADYTSVFKTRPKVAVSPVLSPERGLIVDGSLEHQMEELNIENGQA